MNMEKFPAPDTKKEALVPEEKQVEFAAAAEEGKTQEELSKDMQYSASHMKGLSQAGAGLAAVLGPAAVLTGNPLVGAGAIYTGVKAFTLGKEAKKTAQEAEVAKEKSEQSYSESRGIVEEGMKQGGAEVVEGELRATPEQIEAARQEMIEKYGGGDKS